MNTDMWCVLLFISYIACFTDVKSITDTHHFTPEVKGSSRTQDSIPIVPFYLWEHLSTTTGDIPPMNGGSEQTASLVADVNNDGINDIFIAERTQAPALIGLIRNKTGWQRMIIEPELLRIEAGAAAYDIDQDGDIDLVFGGEARSNEVWWWENPYPDFDPAGGWTRHTIKRHGQTKHHDRTFIDCDGDGKPELVFWNQSANTLFYARIPAKPTQVTEWEIQPVYTYSSDGEMVPRSAYPPWRQVNEHEGLYGQDMDGDGVQDIVAGGRWFKYQQGHFIENIIDASYTFTRIVAGQLIEGGRPEVVMVVGDGIGPMILYQWKQGIWTPQVLMDSVDNGHTLEIQDFNHDGHLDLFNAEMRFGEGNPDAEVRILLGDGTGHFQKLVVATGFGVHEGKLADLDGDGDLDVLGKPYSWQSPRLDIWINEGPQNK